MDFTSLLDVRAYDLGQPYFPGMPHFPSHPPFLYSLTKKHGDILYGGGVTSAADAIAMGRDIPDGHNPTITTTQAQRE